MSRLFLYPMAVKLSLVPAVPNRISTHSQGLTSPVVVFLPVFFLPLTLEHHLCPEVGPRGMTIRPGMP